MTNDIYSWPDPMRLYPDQGRKSYRWKRVRFYLRSILHWHIIRHFTVFANQHAELLPLLSAYPSYSYPLVHRFLDKRFNTRRRFQTMCDNITFLPQKLVALGLPPLWEQPINFGEIAEGFELRLNVNEYQAMEGFWALELRETRNNSLIYLLNFGKIEQALLIAVIQGPNFKGSKEIVKLLTKKCYGLRPAYLMVEAMKALTVALGYPQLWGIPQQYQNKSRLVQSKRYVVDYDVIFAESAGIKGDYWQLPLNFDTRRLEDIPSQKRSMYRKRYAMLAQLKQRMQECLNPLMR